MKWNKYVHTGDIKKVYFRPSKPSLVKKGFNSIKTYIQSKIVW